jgi:tetratricopeptide (TPR) repeat protein
VKIAATAARVAALVALILALPRPAAASPAEDLAQARAKFRAGDFQATVALLSPLLYPTRALADPGELSEAHLMLGVAYFELGRKEDAARQFEEALFIDATLTLDPLLHSEAAVEFFDARKASLAKQLTDAADRRRLAEDNERYRQAILNAREVVIEHRDYWINFMPFGAGQFQNGQRRKGVLFFTTEAVLGGTSMALFTAQMINWGFPLRVPPEDRDTVQTLQLFQVGTGGLFFVFAAWGIIDALANYQPTITRAQNIDPSLLPPDFFKREGASSFHLLPMGGPDGAGLAASWEF